MEYKNRKEKVYFTEKFFKENKQNLLETFSPFLIFIAENTCILVAFT